MKILTATLSGLALATVLASAPMAAPAGAALSRLYPSTASGAPEKIVYDAASAMAWLSTLAGYSYARDPNEPNSKMSYGGHEEIISSNFKLIAAGSTVMELYLPGSPSEMTIMYHMDGPNRLQANHYCAARNVPQMRFVPSKTPGIIRFVFDGGTNLNPSVDNHVHDMTYRIIDKDSYETTTTTYDGGKPMVRNGVRHRQPMKTAAAG